MKYGFLVSVPHARLHGTISILKQRPKLPTNVYKVRAVKNFAGLARRARDTQKLLVNFVI